MSFDSSAFLKSLTTSPGIYQMYNANGDILYVGKAKNLKNRVTSYFRKTGHNAKTQALVSHIDHIEVTLTKTEAEALILENNLIKQQHPPYNIMLRDDKSYPYILVTDEKWPRVAIHRGAKKKKGHYFGPFPNSQAAYETMTLLQKVFQVRQCQDSFFRNRSRPCLQYQIKRCTAPCVENISVEEYARDVQHTADFLKGENETLTQSLIEEMNQCAEQLAYERAAYLRDQINRIRLIQTDQVMEKGSGNLDILGADMANDECCMHLLFVRQGKIIGSRSFYPKARLGETINEMIALFIAQHYLSGPEAVIPNELLLGQELADHDVLNMALTHHAKRRVLMRIPQRGRGVEWLNVANKAAEQNLRGRLASKQSYQKRLQHLASALSLPTLPTRMECYDISHTQGELTVGSCVVFDNNGPAKASYRTFNIEGITGGDDYAAMEQVLRRRFTRLQRGEGQMPELVIIDGGKGQLTKAIEVFDELGIEDVMALGVAKGVTRKSGWERFFVGRDHHEVVIDPATPGFHLLQHIRDEAHRFAITGHKARRGKKITKSPLEQIPGVGPKRRKALLQHFGGLKGIEAANTGDLVKVEGISRELAEQIHDFFHSS